MIFFFKTSLSFERKHFVTSQADLFATSMRNLKAFFTYLKVPVSVETFVSPAKVRQGAGRGRETRAKVTTEAGSLL